MGEALTELALTLAWAIDHIRETGKGLMVLPATSKTSDRSTTPPNLPII